MARTRKITVELPQDLLEKAQQASGTGIAQTVRAGLQLVAASWTMLAYSGSEVRSASRTR